MFRDRTEAGRHLAAALAGYRDEDVVVLGLPRGGVPVAAEIAADLKAPLDLILVRKIGLPGQSELAMGAVVDGPTPVVVRNDEVIRAADISEREFDAACAEQLGEIERRRRRYLGDRPSVPVADRTVIVVDDGLATGATMRAALRAIRKGGPAKVVLAVPVAPPDTLQDLSTEVDDVVCLEIHATLGSIGSWYGDFHQVSDAEVIAALTEAWPKPRETRQVLRA